MEDQDFDIYDDLLEFEQKEEKKSKELQAWEDKYAKSLQENETLRQENKDLRKKKKTIELSFQSLLDTARAEIKRLEKQIVQLRKEKDDICFRRKRPRQELDQKQTFELDVEDRVFTKKDEKDVAHCSMINACNPFKDALKEPFNSVETIKTPADAVSNSSSEIGMRVHDTNKTSKESENSHQTQTVYNHRSKERDEYRRHAHRDVFDYKDRSDRSDEHRRHAQRDVSDYRDRSSTKHQRSGKQKRYDQKYELREDNYGRNDRSRREERHRKDSEKEKRHKSDKLITDRHKSKTQNIDVASNINVVCDNSEKIRTAKKLQVDEHGTVASYKERHTNDINIIGSNIVRNEKIEKKSTTQQTKDNEILKSIVATLSVSTLAKETSDNENLFQTQQKSRQTPPTTDVNSNTIQHASFDAKAPSEQIKPSNLITPKKIELFDQLFGQTPIQAVTTSDDSGNKDLVTKVLGMLNNNTLIAMTPKDSYTPIQETCKVGVPNETKSITPTNLDECFIPNKISMSGSDIVPKLASQTEISLCNIELIEERKELNSNREDTLVKPNEKTHKNTNSDEFFKKDFENEFILKNNPSSIAADCNKASTDHVNVQTEKTEHNTKSETATVPKNEDINMTIEDTNSIKKKNNTEIDECIDIDEELTAKNLASVSTPTITQPPSIWKPKLDEDERLSNIVNTYNLLKSKLLPTATEKEDQLITIIDEKETVLEEKITEKKLNTKTTYDSIVSTEYSFISTNSNHAADPIRAQGSEILADLKQNDKLIGKRQEDRVEPFISNTVMPKLFSEKPVSNGLETTFSIKDSTLAEKPEIEILASNEQKDDHNTVQQDALVYGRHKDLEVISNEKKLIEKEQIVIIEDIRLPDVLDLENISSDKRLNDEQVVIKTTSDNNNIPSKSNLLNLPDDLNNKQSLSNERNESKLAETPEKLHPHVTDELLTDTDPLRSISSDAIEMALSALHDTIPLSPKKRYSRQVLSKNEQVEAAQNNESSDDLLNILGNSLNDQRLLAENDCEEDAVMFLHKLNGFEEKKAESNENLIIANETVKLTPIFQAKNREALSSHSSEIILPAANVLIHKSNQPTDIQIEPVKSTLEINPSGVYSKTSKLKKFKIPKIKKDQLSKKDEMKSIIFPIEETDAKLSMMSNVKKQAALSTSSLGQNIEKVSPQRVKRGRGRPRKNQIKEIEKPVYKENIAEQKQIFKSTNASLESLEITSSTDLVGHKNDAKQLLTRQNLVEHSTFDLASDMLNSTANSSNINDLSQEHNKTSDMSVVSPIFEDFEDQIIVSPAAKRPKLVHDEVLPIVPKNQNGPVVESLNPAKDDNLRSPTNIANNTINSICDDCPNTNTSSFTNVTIDETVVSCVADTSSISLKNNSGTTHNDTTLNTSGGIVTKCVSLGSSEYRFEQMPNNTIKLFVKRHGRLRRANHALSNSSPAVTSGASANSVQPDNST